jgi:HAD superfamily hydrolase (TIGR01509 family)
MRTMTRAVIFDMDGVLVDSEPLHLLAANEVLAPHGVHLTAAENSGYLGWTEEAFWLDVCRRHQLTGTPAAYRDARRDRVLELMAGRPPIAPGIDPFLRRLRARGLRLGVASSSDAAVIESILSAGGLAAYFDAIAAGDEVARSKPDPEIYLLAAARLDVEPRDCVVFEDAPHGIEAALRAGMRCIRVVTETTRDLACPDTIDAIETFVGLEPARVLGDAGPGAGRSGAGPTDAGTPT